MKKVMLACATVVLLVAMGACKGGADNKKAEEVEFTLAGTTWMGVFEEDWTEPLVQHNTDTSIWRFETDSTGSIYEHWIAEYPDPYMANYDSGGEDIPMTYTYDPATKKGVLHGYQTSDFSDKVIEFTYNSEDKTLVYSGDEGPIVHHLVTE